jgi:hypothetical protein
MKRREEECSSGGGKVLKFLVLAALTVTAISLFPDLKRYIGISTM